METADACISQKIPCPRHYGCLFSPQLDKISVLEKLDRHLQGFGVGLVHLKPLSKKKSPALPEVGGGGQRRGEGAGRHGGSEPDQSSVCNNRSVEADDRLRQSASRAEWALQPGLSTSTTTAEEKAAGGKGAAWRWVASRWEQRHRLVGVGLKIIQLTFSIVFTFCFTNAMLNAA